MKCDLVIKKDRLLKEIKKLMRGDTENSKSVNIAKFLEPNTVKRQRLGEPAQLTVPETQKSIDILLKCYDACTNYSREVSSLLFKSKYTINNNLCAALDSESNIASKMSYPLLWSLASDQASPDYHPTASSHVLPPEFIQLVPKDDCVCDLVIQLNQLVSRGRDGSGSGSGTAAPGGIDFTDQEPVMNDFIILNDSLLGYL